MAEQVMQKVKDSQHDSQNETTTSAPANQAHRNGASTKEATTTLNPSPQNNQNQELSTWQRRQNQQAVAGALNRLMSPATFSPAAFFANPWETMRRMQSDMDSLFASLGSPNSWNGRAQGESRRDENQSSSLSRFTPRVEAFEREGKMILRVELPGLKKDQVDIDVDGDVLTVRGERRQEERRQENGLYHSEISYGQFERSFRLPEGIAPEQIEASFTDGVLEISLPQPKPTRKTHKVQVS